MNSLFFSIILPSYCMASITNIQVEDKISRDEDYFGRFISISGDHLIVASEDNAYIFERYTIENINETEYYWEQTKKWSGSAHGGISAVAVSGNVALIGTDSYRPDWLAEGAAFVLTRLSDGVWTQTHFLHNADRSDLYGSSVAVSLQNKSEILAKDTIVIGSKGDSTGFYGGRHGSADVYEYTPNDGNGIWNKIETLTASDMNVRESEYFGACVAVSGDYIIVGNGPIGITSDSSYKAYIFERDPDASSVYNQWSEKQILKPTDGSGGFFGSSVAISGERAVVGRFGDETKGYRAGSAYVYERNDDSNGWELVQKLYSSDIARNDAFGISVAISDDLIVVGASKNDDVGSVYLFERKETDTGVSWTEVAKLSAFDAPNSDLPFGRHVAIEGNNVAIGAVGVMITNFRGAAYSYIITNETYSNDIEDLLSTTMTEASATSTYAPSDTLTLTESTKDKSYATTNSTILFSSTLLTSTDLDQPADYLNDSHVYYENTENHTESHNSVGCRVSIKYLTWFIVASLFFMNPWTCLF